MVNLGLIIPIGEARPFSVPYPGGFPNLLVGTDSSQPLVHTRCTSGFFFCAGGMWKFPGQIEPVPQQSCCRDTTRILIHFTIRELLSWSFYFFLHSSVLSKWLFPRHGVVSSQACTDQYWAENLKETLCGSPQFFLCAALFCLLFCSLNSSHLGLPRRSALSLQLRLWKSSGFYPCSPSLGCPLETLSRK